MGRTGGSDLFKLRMRLSETSCVAQHAQNRQIACLPSILEQLLFVNLLDMVD